jgi:hypothetical protein
MVSAKELAARFESMAKSNEPPPQPASSSKPLSAKKLAQKFERLQSSVDASPTPPGGAPTERPESSDPPAPPSSANKTFGGAPKCPGCGKAVYHAERVVGLGNVDWHKACLRCSLCKKTLGSVADIADRKGEIFCNACYARLHGAKGFRGATGGTMHTE